MRNVPRYESCALTDLVSRDLLRHVLVVASVGTNPDNDLYFIQVKGGGPVKIGVSSNVYARMNSLQTACPYPLEVRHIEPRMGLVERYLHARFSDTRLMGEWFETTPELEALMAGDVDATFILDSPSLDGVTPWRDVDGRSLSDEVDRLYDSCLRSPMWSDCSRVLRKNYLRNSPSIGALYDELIRDEARFAA